MPEKKLFCYRPPIDKNDKQAMMSRGHKVKVASGLYLRQGEAMYLDPDLVYGVPHLVEVNADGSDAHDRYSRPNPYMPISIPEDEDGALAEAAEAERERRAKTGVKKAAKRVFKVAKSDDEQANEAAIEANRAAIEAAMAEADKPKPRRKKTAKTDEPADVKAEAAEDEPKKAPRTRKAKKA